MSIQVHELLESRAFSRKGGKLTGTRSFHVWDDASPITSPEALRLLFGSSGLPIDGEAFPQSPNLVAKDYDAAKVAGHSDLWLVRWEYSESGIVQGQLQPADPGYCEISANITAQRVDAWRMLTDSELASMTASGGDWAYGDGNFDEDIGGVSIDAAGDPLSSVVRQVEITISEVRLGIPNLSFTLPFVWRRNSNRFLGAPIGQLLYAGCTVNRIDINKFTFDHKFILDRWWHMRQLAVTDAFGKVDTMDIGSEENPRAVAATVLFVQEFTGSADFFALSPNFSGVA
jgi:hypothetical protein